MENKEIITKKERLARKAARLVSDKNGSSPILATKWEMMKNIVEAAKDAIASGLDVRTPEDTEKALTICAGCEYLNREQGRCGVCGCYLKVKTALTAWHCPIGKW